MVWRVVILHRFLSNALTSYIKSFIPKSFLSSQLYSMIIKGLRYLPCWRNFHDCSSMRWDGRKDNLQHQACCSLLKHLEITCQFLVDSLHLHVDLMPLKIVNYFRFSKDLFLKKKKTTTSSFELFLFVCWHPLVLQFQPLPTFQLDCLLLFCIIVSEWFHKNDLDQLQPQTTSQQNFLTNCKIT